MLKEILVGFSSNRNILDSFDQVTIPEFYFHSLFCIGGVSPVIVPSLGSFSSSILDYLDGLVFTGSPFNVYPELYGKDPDLSYEPYDICRDETTLPLLRQALARKIPVLCLCRGCQELNVSLGGSLQTEIQEQPGIIDHRKPNTQVFEEAFVRRHRVTIRQGGFLSDVLGAATEDLFVNSLHRQAVDVLGDNLRVEAISDDGIIEAISYNYPEQFAVGFQWHPEAEFVIHKSKLGSEEFKDNDSFKIFDAFYSSCRKYSLSRG